MGNVDRYRTEAVTKIVAELKASRQMQGISASVLAAQADLPRSSLLMWEREESQPHLGPLRQWAEALGYELAIDIKIKE